MASTSGPKPISAPAPDDSEAHIRWLFVVGGTGHAVLHCLELKSSQTGTTVMQLLKKAVDETKSTRHCFYSRVELEDAIVSPLCIGDREAQEYPRRVIIESRKARPDLTEAFHNPTLLRGTGFLRLHRRFEVSTTPECHAILIKTRISKDQVAGVVALTILFSIAVGVGSGMWARDAKVGLAAFGGTIAVFALIQASLSGAVSLKSVKAL